MSKRCSNVVDGLKRYSESSTIHGISYICPQADKLSVRSLIWLCTVFLSLLFAIWTSYNLYVSWKEDPVLTTIENFAYPIQNIEFPAITICPQGADNSILRSVLYKQFNEYLAKKDLSLSDLTLEEAKLESIKFLNETYPGAKKSPDNYVTLFRAQNVNSNIKTQANINGEDNIHQCDSTLNMTKQQKRNVKYEACPINTMSDEHGNCIHVSDKEFAYSEAIEYCKNIVSDRSSDVYQFLQDSDIEFLYSLYDEGKFLV